MTTFADMFSDFPTLQHMPQEFADKIGGSTDHNLNIEFFKDEASEFVIANFEWIANDDPSKNVELFAEVLKELGDSLYTLLAVIYFWGKNGSLKINDDGLFKAVNTVLSWPGFYTLTSEDVTEIVTRVHLSNLTKINPETGEVVKDETGKVLKGEFYKAPDLTDISARLLGTTLVRAA